MGFPTLFSTGTMSKQDILELNGEVRVAHPQGRFSVHVPENNLDVLCVISGKIRMNRITIAVGDKVRIEMSPTDLTRGRIVYRTR